MQAGSLVEVETEDRLRLHGFFQRPNSSGPNSLRESIPPSVAAWIVVHGVGGNFYGSSLLATVAAGLLESGASVLRVNTRGHDAVSLASTPGGASRQGAAYEDVSKCVEDLNAWIGWLGNHSDGPIGLLGHSLGGVKVLFAQGMSPQSAVKRVIAVSPPRLCYSSFLQDRDSEVFLECLAEAEQWMQQGKPEHMMRGRFPFPLMIAAGSYLDKYGPEEKYDYMKQVPKLDIPWLFTFGEKELQPGKRAFDGMPEMLQPLRELCPDELGL